ncbi:radical SAM protein [Clostridium aminobutyricum]|uniref:B12-binding domain-containing radical SAM protein n=1 Tax=Clostridium aminobutyricum TaxID=33953 RepID=A0A939DAM7_CLOAM|nr:radical SAM protein [Clostridium aminobutyricum]MBN7774231.1 B12-binding domain-containing radical SAM protein [Clostridium aminobutyricum]
MRYEGNIFRPPSEAYSLIIQVTIGCAHNKCTFCSMFKDKKFRVRDVKEVLEDLDMARRTYRNVEKIFLADGDALCLSNNKLLLILAHIKKLFPECKRVGVYGSPQDVLVKTPEELIELRKNGIGIIYIGAESGSEQVLKDIQKGVTRAQLIEAVQKIEASGIQASVTFISGLAGPDRWEEHALETASMISAMQPSYVGLLTLMVEPAAPIYNDIQAGRFKILTAEEVLAETMLMLKNINVTKPCVFRSNHASNYVSLKGELPADKDRMVNQLRAALHNTNLIKDERFRAL